MNNLHYIPFYVSCYFFIFQFRHLFRKFILIMVTTNITCTDFFELLLNLKTESYQPFRKPNNDPIHIDINSNDPLQILKQLPLVKDYPKYRRQKKYMINGKRSTKESLNNSCFYKNLIYHQDNRKKNKHKKIKKHQRKSIWFNFQN